CPELSAKDVNWRMALTIGAYMYAFSDTHRLDELAPTECDPNDTTEVIEEITAFVTAGLRAPPVYPR
ncbi:MAG TPA: TetR/AcrR family transcriptional regulator, partial [Pusillimonas sp.]|nr:TetR/AcrR family transcriptional regulator [Pusillimonas sp.]